MKRTKSGSRALLVWFQTACGNGSEKKVRASAENRLAVVTKSFLGDWRLVSSG